MASTVDLRTLPPFSPAAHSESTNSLGLYDDVTLSLDSFHQRPAAVGAALAAVVAQPSSVRARYLLACTLAASGMHDKAQATLGVLLAAPGCPECTDTLLNVARDIECGFDARDVALTSKLAPSPLRAAADAVLAALASGKVATVTPYLGAGPVTFMLSGDNCDSDCTNQIVQTRTQVIQVVRDVERRADDGEGFTGPMRLFCSHGCCEGPNPSHSHAPITHVRKLCFSDGAHPRWTSLFALKGG